MDRSPAVLDVPLNSLLHGLGQQDLPGKEGVCTVREMWGLRALMSHEMVSKIEILMKAYEGITLDGLRALKEKDDEGVLTPEEGKKVAAMKAAMQIF